MAYAMLTTVDNPFDPRDQWDDWRRYDEDHGYNSCGLLARIAVVSDSLPDEVNDSEIEEAIDDIVRFDPTKRFKKVIYEEQEESSTD